MAVFLSLMPGHFRGQARRLSLSRTIYSLNEYTNVSRLQCFQPEVLIAQPKLRSPHHAYAVLVQNASELFLFHTCSNQRVTGLGPSFRRDQLKHSLLFAIPQQNE